MSSGIHLERMWCCVEISEIHDFPLAPIRILGCVLSEQAGRHTAYFTIFSLNVLSKDFKNPRYHIWSTKKAHLQGRNSRVTNAQSMRDSMHVLATSTSFLVFVIEHLCSYLCFSKSIPRWCPYHSVLV